MDPITIGLLSFLGMLSLIAVHVPVGMAMAIAGVAGFSIMTGNPLAAVSMFGSETATAISSPHLIIIPMFLLMGSFAGVSGLASDLYHLANSLFGHRRGGLAMATVAGCGGFGAACGSSIATTATMARIPLPEMERRGYAESLGAGSIAAIQIVVRRNPSLAPDGPRQSWKQIARTAASSWGIVSIILIMTAGLYGGVFTVIEAAAAGTLIAFAFAVARGKLNRDSFFRTIGETASNVGLLYTILIGAHIFSNFIAITRLPAALVDWVVGLGLPALAIIFVLAAIYTGLGAIFDLVAAMIIMLPFVFPLVTDGLGYDPIWWGVVMIMVIEISIITPPIGINVFVTHGVRRDIPLGTIFRGIVSFLLADFVRLTLVILFSAIALWLPRTM